MKDRFGRTIEYLRVSVTDRCNLRCTYCMPPGGISGIRHEDVLSYEQIADFAREAVRLGFVKVRLTGGEPLVRRGVVSLVEMLAGIDGIRDLAMTTNGTLLAPHARALREAGLHRVNISLDAMSSDRYAEITRGGCLQDVLAGISEAKAVGLAPIKINCVVEESSDEPDARDVARYARANGLEVRFIPRMDLRTGEFRTVDGGDGGNCACCTRLRLSSDGWLRPCLFSDTKISIRGRSAEEAIREAIRIKPESGAATRANEMHRIGG